MSAEGGTSRGAENVRARSAGGAGRERGRRPVTPDEVPHLVAVGELLRGLRLEASLTQAEVAARASMRPQSVSGIERGEWRTRRSTLERMVCALVDDDDRAEVLVEELVAAAGPALAPESRYAERAERRRRRRKERAIAQAAADVGALRAALEVERRLVRRFPDRIDADGSAVIVAELERRIVRAERLAGQRPVKAPAPAISARSRYQQAAQRIAMLGARATADDFEQLRRLRAEADAETSEPRTDSSRNRAAGGGAR